MTQDNIFREVDEELRSERVRTLWRRFGPYVIAAMVGVVLIVAVKEGWDWWQSSQSAAASDEFYTALELSQGSDIAAAQEALNKVIASNAGGYPTLARFKQASLLAKDGKVAEAVAAYDALASSETNKHMRELALVFAGMLLVDGGDVAQVEQRVGGLVGPESPMHNAAREALGLVNYQAGNLAAAREQFESIVNDPLATNDLRSRIQVYLAQLAAEGEAVPAEEIGADAIQSIAPDTTAAPAADATPAPAEATAPVETPAPAETMPPAETTTPAN